MNAGRKTGGCPSSSSGSKLTDREAHLIVAIAGHRTAHDIGPSWAWLRGQLALERPELDAALHHLRRRQMVSFGSEAGSLDATTEGRNRALEWIADYRRRPRPREARA